VSQQVFTALADPVRRELLRSLADRGPSTVTELAANLPVTRQAVAKHLAILVAAGLAVAGSAEGRRVPYTFRAAPLDEARAWMDGLAARWDDRLERLERHLREKQ
jgi:DNA-binding transcriptional ArsR family regulator